MFVPAMVVYTIALQICVRGMSKKVFTIKLKSGLVLRTDSHKSDAKVVATSKAEASSQKQKLRDYVGAASAISASNAAMKRHIVHALIHSLNHNSNQALVQTKYNRFMGF